MSKRKRLTSPVLKDTETDSDRPALETKSAFPNYPLGVAPKPRAPIAQVAGDAAMHSALSELTDEIAQARRSGRMVQALPLDAVVDDHLARDRMVIAADDMDTLMASLRSRGQQTPIEVVALPGGAYGLVSGWRRLRALRALYAETPEERFATVAALIKPLDDVSDSYVAMVEENEIRTNPSFYERAHLVAEAVKLGVYPTPALAIKTLFANTTPVRRSKITSFVKLHAALGGLLRFPADIPEKLGLQLVKAFGEDPALLRRLKDVLRKTPAATPKAERAALERSLRAPSKVSGAKASEQVEIAPGLTLKSGKGRLTLSGPGVTDALQRDLAAWLARR